ncbi:TonB C-terminal domain-containing protein [Cupriavidus sp. AcVe19-6a]|uniref:TonB C-terminal domain-containing protein n=1 Tax=Cupriavidus sp. AcVe19-6a TaxID=2821358 RepID=UPI001AE57D04|nr:TonB C-terminal domain-containing protein [Cupriavidus sp. AcVe19-6a]
MGRLSPPPTPNAPSGHFLSHCVCAVSQLSYQGALIAIWHFKSSGNEGWDNAVLRAVERSDPLPRDENGTAPASLNITFWPNQ